MKLPSTPPVPMTKNCVECEAEIREGQVRTQCPYCLGSLCPRCAQGHYERKNHPLIPPTA